MSDGRMDELRRRQTSGEYLAAVHLARQILDDPESLSDAEAIEACQIGAESSLALAGKHDTSRYHDALRFTADERTWATATGDIDRIAVAIYHGLTVSLFIGDHAAVLGAFDDYQAIDTPPRPGLDRYRPAVLFNVGNARLMRHDDAGALAAFRSAREAADQQGNRSMAIRCLLQMAWVELVANRLEPGGAYLYRAVDMLTSEDMEYQLTALCYRALYHWKAQERKMAIDLCAEVLHATERPGWQDHHGADAGWIAGECALELGDVAKAKDLGDYSLRFASVGRVSSAINRANNLLQRVRQAMNENQGLG